MLRFTTLIAASLAAATPVLAAPMEYGEGDGVRFAYSIELRSNGFIRIAGAILSSKEPFALDVSPTGHVDGNFGDVPVEYNVGKKVRDAVVAQLEQGPAVASAK